MNRRLVCVVATVGSVLAGCSSGSTTTTSPSGATPIPAAATSARNPFVVTSVATFDEPWAMAFLPGTPYLAITQRGGKLLLRQQATGRITEVTGVPAVKHAGQGGLGDIVPSPAFATDHTVYFSWAEAGDGDTAGAAVGRAKLSIGAGTASLTDLTVLWRQDPKVTGAGHYGHRIAISPDRRYLFISSGERQKFDPAQDLSVNLGKIIRLRIDGSVPPDNPSADRGGVTAQIWSSGHRNPLGLAFDPSGRLWESEMGPKGGDEVNLILPGRNYGWPKASNGSHYDGRDIPDHTPSDGFEPPKVWWNPSISPGSLMIYTGKLFPQWNGDAFIGALSGKSLIRVDISGDTASKGDQWGAQTDPLLGQRIRAVQQAPDGSIWLLQDGPAGQLLRLTRS